MPETEKLVQSLAAGSTLSCGLVKRPVNVTSSRTIESQMELESQRIADISITADAKEGVRAFLARRNAVFTGK